MLLRVLWFRELIQGLRLQEKDLTDRFAVCLGKEWVAYTSALGNFGNHARITTNYAVPEALINLRLLHRALQLSHATKGNFNEFYNNVNAKFIIQLTIIYNSNATRLKLVITGKDFFSTKKDDYEVILVFKCARASITKRETAQTYEPEA